MGRSMPKPSEATLDPASLPQPASAESTLLDVPRRTFYRRYEAAILGAAAIIVALAIWQWFWSAGKISPLFFTGPSAIVKRFAEEWTEGRLKSDMVYSGTNFAIGVGLPDVRTRTRMSVPVLFGLKSGR